MSDEAQAPAQRRFRLKARHWVFGAAVASLLLLVGAFAWLDTGMGHRFIADRIATLSPRSGLKIRIGSIEGSIYKKAVLRDVRLYDPKGLFLSSPRVELDWWPVAWFSNRLDIDRLSIPRATLHKWPQFIPAEEKGPLLPDFDIRLVALHVGELTVNQGVTGRPHLATLRGRMEIFSGRARVDLYGRVIGEEDRIVLNLDSRPDDDMFGLRADVNAPEGGLIGSLSGLTKPAALKVEGEGSWSKWDGTLSATLDEAALADLNLEAARGQYRLTGTVQPQLLRQGLIGRLSASGVEVEATGTLQDRMLAGQMALRSEAVALNAQGGIDLGHSLFDDLRIDARLRRPSALIKTARGRKVALKLRFDGSFGRAAFEYLLTAPEFALGSTRFIGLRATGKGRARDDSPTLIPINMHARRMLGQGEIVEGVFANMSLEGVLQLQGQAITSNRMKLHASKLNSNLVLLADLRTGRFDAALTGNIRGIPIRGFGLVDVQSDIHVVPREGGGLALTGRARANVRRFDNGFFRGLAGGLPSLFAKLSLGPEGRLHLQGMTLEAPKLRLTASGYRRRDGTFLLSGAGKHQRYGPLRLTLDGKIERPEVDLLLARPLDAAGLADVRVRLTPDPEGFDFTVEGGSRLGPFDGEGQILLPRGGQAVIDFHRLSISDSVAAGEVRPLADGLVGRLEISGGGMSGFVALQPVDGVQQLRAELNARNANFMGPPAFRVQRGRLTASVLFNPEGPGIDAALQARGVRRGTMRIGRIDANTRLVDGRGTATASLSGQRGRLFDLRFDADIAPGRVALTASGSLDRKAVRIVRPAVLTGKEDGGWALAPTNIAFAGGRVQLSGELGGPSTHVEARLDRLPLTILDIYNENLGLGGVATGTLSYARPRGALPTGKTQLRIRGLTRSGLAVSSRPVDAGVNAVLTERSAVARAVVVREGKTIGRAQLRLAPLGEGYIFDRLSRATLFAQLRYDGQADTLWRLINLEAFDLSGPMSVAMDVRGTLADPIIRGSVATDGARLSSPVTGMALSNVAARGSFSGSRLVLSSFNGRSKGGGTLTGGGSFDFGVASGVGMDLRLEADEAVLLDRDDLGATVTGPIRIRSEGIGGTISGDVRLIRSRFMLGRASAVAEVPALRTIEVNRRGEIVADDEPSRASPWRLDISADARNRLRVTGLGLNSEWRARLKIGGTVTDPAVAGTASLIRGNYEFAGRNFDLEEGEIRFAENTPVNPNLDIDASADITDLNAMIHVGGTGLQPEISFTSTPAMPEDELLSRLLFGSSITDLSAPEALQLAAAVASLRGGGDGGLNPINAVRKAAGLDRLRILPADSTTGQGTSVAAGKYITRRGYVELITDGQGYSATRVEFQITRWLSLLSSISTLGRQSASVRISKDY